MERFTNEQVAEQKERFEKFLTEANLTKIGDRIVHFIMNAEGRYNSHNYIHTVLRRVANVHGAMYHPTRKLFYSDILQHDALTASMQARKK